MIDQNTKVGKIIAWTITILLWIGFVVILIYRLSGGRAGL